MCIAQNSGQVAFFFLYNSGQSLYTELFPLPTTKGENLLAF